MTQPFLERHDVPPLPHQGSKGGPFGRILAFVGGAAVLLGGMVASLGLALVGALGMALATWVQRMRRRHLSRWGGWLAATGSVFVVAAVIATVVAVRVPPDTWRQAKQAGDSAAAAASKKPPPEWLQRIAPQATQRAAQRPQLSQKTTDAFVAGGIGIGAAMWVAFFGTFGWGGGMLLGFAFTGQWPGGDRRVEIGHDVLPNAVTD